MAFGRKMLKAMGIEEEKIDQLIDAHMEVVDGLKDKLSKAEADAAKLVEVQKELDALKSGDNYEEKYKAEHKAFEDFKAAQTAKEQQAAKETAARTYFESKGITGGNLEIAMKGARDEIAGLEMDGKNIKDNKSLEDLVSGTFAGLIVTKERKGVDTPKPLINGGMSLKSREQIYERDEKGRFKLDASQRQEALAQIITNEQQKG